MPFYVISGTFHVSGYSPDGDSIRFKPDNPFALAVLTGPPAKVNGRGHTQLRIEAIDSLETHYTPPSGGGSTHQPEALARASTDHLLNFLSIEDVVWDSTHTNVVSARDGTAGYILSRSVEKNGRPVAFVYTGELPSSDGSSFRLEAEFLTGSYNFASLSKGLTYATYYWGLFSDLRDKLTEAVSLARSAKLGVYSEDVTNSGFEVVNLGQLMDNHVIMPKLFRRLSEYFVSAGTVKGFKETLALAKEPVLEISNANFTHFDTFVTQEENSTILSLSVRPEELVFDPMPTRPPNAFSAVITNAALRATK